MKKIEKYYYLWLTLIEDINYMLYLYLIQNFNSIENLYKMSTNESYFNKYLKSKNIVLSKKVISKLINENIKKLALFLYNKIMKMENMYIIPINSKEYFSGLKNRCFPPLCLIVKNNTNLFENVNVKVYESKEKTSYARNLVKYIYNNRIINKNSNFMDINLYVKGINFNLIQNYKDECENYIFYHKKQENYLENVEIKSGITDILIIPEAEYNSVLSLQVDNMLEQGKDILVFPNNIFSKYATFSNDLIKNGADVATNIIDVINLIKRRKDMK